MMNNLLRLRRDKYCSKCGSRYTYCRECGEEIHYCSDDKSLISLAIQIPSHRCKLDYTSLIPQQGKDKYCSKCSDRLPEPYYCTSCGDRVYPEHRCKEEGAKFPILFHIDHECD